MKEGLCEKEENPVTFTHDPGEGAKPRDRVLSDDELRAVWNACGDDEYGRIIRYGMPVCILAAVIRLSQAVGPSLICSDRNPDVRRDAPAHISLSSIPTLGSAFDRVVDSAADVDSRGTDMGDCASARGERRHQVRHSFAAGSVLACLGAS